MSIKNLGTNLSFVDRSTRFFVGVSLAVITAPGMPFLEGVSVKYVVFAFALANLFAAATGWCAGYALFGYSTCKADQAPSEPTLEELGEFSSDKLSHNHSTLRTTIIATVVILMLGLASAFMYQLIGRAQERGKVENAVILVTELQQLSSQVAEALASERSDVDSGSSYMAVGNLRLTQYMAELASQLPSVARVEVDDNTQIAGFGLNTVGEGLLLQEFDKALVAMYKNEIGNTTEWGQPYANQYVFFTFLGQDYIGIKAQLAGAADGWLTFIQLADGGQVMTHRATKRGLIVIAIVFWIVGWLTYVLTRAVGLRIQESNALIELSFKRIANHSKELEEMVAVRTRDVEQAQQEAVTASRAKSSFLANMSHEIRTPLNAIIGMNHLALQSDPPAKVRGYLNTVSTSAEMLLGIINDILDFSKIEAGKMAIEHAEFSIEELAKGVLDILRLKAEEKGLELMFDLDPELPQALIGDRLRLSQILSNLGSNAVKFTDAGGEIIVRLRVDSKNGSVIRLRGEVQDTGIGITPEHQRNLFRSFSQADATITRQFGGTGLGLAISKSLCELMNGRIWVESKPNVGSTFQFVVELGIPDEISTPAKPALPDLKVLVVDDSKNARIILEGMLSAYGNLQVHAVHGGSAAIKRLQEADADSPYDLVLMDWRMPDLDGIETTQLIQWDKKISHTPAIVLVSDHGNLDLKDVASDVTFAGILSKPLMPSVLARVLKNVSGTELTAVKSTTESDVEDTTCADQLRGTRILLADDNEINQELMTEILDAYGIEVTTANNGKEAIAALEKGNFDGVLMDCQMPVMDGYTATTEIRKQARFKDLPILALTANAMDQDRLHSLQSGMNDHISKPVNFDAMIETMCRWIKPRNANAAESSGSTENRELTAPEIRAQLTQISGIDPDVALVNLAGKIEIYWRMLKKFPASQGSFESQFREALKDGYDAARQAAHGLKGVSANLAITKVSNEAAQLEELCKNEAPFTEIDEQLARVLDELGHIIQQLEKI